MRISDSYGDRNPKELVAAFRYSISHGYNTPQKYVKKNLVQEDVLNTELLKSELDFIIKKTPVNLLAFGREKKNFKILEAEVENFVGIEGKEIPRDIYLHLNYFVEMMEPDLGRREIIDFFKALPDMSVVCFRIGEKNGYFGERDFVNVSINRYHI